MADRGVTMEEFVRSFFEVDTNISAWALPDIRITDIIDILLIAFIIYELLIWFRKTRAWILLKGIFFLFAFAGVSIVLQLNMTQWIFKATINVGVIAVIIIFQPELRRALEQIGRGSFLSSVFNVESHTLSEENVEALVYAMEQMSSVKTGALIVIEQEVALGEYEQTGIPIDAAISSQLIMNIFEHNTPLHDGAMIIREDRILSATCYLPLSENQEISKELGTRHRAALGLSEISDSKIFVVSEETGHISMAYSGQLYRHIDGDFIRRELLGEKRSKVNKLKARLMRRKGGDGS